MTTVDDEFTPNWASAPGETIRDILIDKLANDLGESVDFVERLLIGNEPINKQLANKLELCFSVDSKFWLRREEQYRKSLKRLETNNTQSTTGNNMNIDIFDDPVMLQRNVPVPKMLELLGTVDHWSHRLVDVLDNYYRHKLMYAISFGNANNSAVIELLDHIQRVINKYGPAIELTQYNYAEYWIGYIRILETWLDISDGNNYYE